MKREKEATRVRPEQLEVQACEAQKVKRVSLDQQVLMAPQELREHSGITDRGASREEQVHQGHLVTKESKAYRYLTCDVTVCLYFSNLLEI